MDIIYNIEECIWYIEKILVYGSTTEAEHQAIVENVL